jgi:hypothetical protein
MGSISGRDGKIPTSLPDATTIGLGQPVVSVSSTGGGRLLF